MKLAVFGASGGTGRRLVELALARGDELAVLAREPARLGSTADRLRVVSGDVRDLAAVRQTVGGAEAVISVLGPRRGSPPDLLTVGMRNIITAMDEAPVRRLVVLSITAVRGPADRPRFVDRLLEGVGRLLASRVYADHQGQAAEVRSSDLDWTIARAPLLTNGRYTGHHRVGHMGDVGGRVSRADVADFLLAEASDRAYLHQLPLVGS